MPNYADIIFNLNHLLPSMRNGRRIQRQDVRDACAKAYVKLLPKEKIERLRNYFKSHHMETISNIEKVVLQVKQKKIVLKSLTRKEVATREEQVEW